MKRTAEERAAEHHTVMAAIGKPCPKPTGQTRKIKISNADDWFSKCIRERTDWTCERCGRRYEPPTSSLQCSHFVGRANKSTRFYPDNCFAECAGCHSYHEANPRKFTEWVKEKLGPDRYDLLVERELNMETGKEMTRDVKKGLVSRHFRKEYARMKELRSQGVTGRIEFAGWI